MMRFSLAGEEERHAAIGPTEELLSTMKKALDPSAGFEPIAAPGPHDWLANHLEPGQTVEEFVGSRPKRPDALRTCEFVSQKPKRHGCECSPRDQLNK